MVRLVSLLSLLSIIGRGQHFAPGAGKRTATMNGKKAKQLRKQALALTIGKPAVEYRWIGRLESSCTRAVYQKLKRK